MNRDKLSALITRPSVTRTAPKTLTSTAISALKPGKQLADGAIRPGAGSLKIRKRQTAASVVTEWVFEWHRAGRAVRYTVGRYTPVEAENAFTITQARAEAARLQSLVKQGIDPIKVRSDEAIAARAEVRQPPSAPDEGRIDLEALLSTYVKHLNDGGKKASAYDAANMFKNHVLNAFPELACLPTFQVTPEHIARMLGRLVGPSAPRQVGRTALKLRSYLGAAFKLGMGAGLDPMAPAGASKFNLTNNPASAVPPRAMAAKFNRIGERTLSEAELRVFLSYVFAWPSKLQRLALLFQIFAGGQRAAQLLRIRHSDLSEDAVFLYDAKGRRATPRTHALPMTIELQEIVDALKRINSLDPEKSGGGLLFESRGSVVRPETLSGVVEDIRDAMLDAGEAATSFRGGDVRRTAETLLSGKLKVSKDHRAQLLSHGLGGVQDVVYDKDLHLEAKRAVLERWSAYLLDLCLSSNVLNQPKNLDSA